MNGQAAAPPPSPGPAPVVVTVIGPESTGKTTLARLLAADFRTAWSPEFARTYAERRLASDATPLPLGATDVEPIARGQIAAEDAAAARAHAAGRALVIRDTDLASTVVYARHYYGACPSWIVDTARARRAALYLLCDVDVPWVGDPARDRPFGRAAMHAEFRAVLEELGARTAAVRGGWEARHETAREAVAALLAHAPHAAVAPLPPAAQVRTRDGA